MGVQGCSAWMIDELEGAAVHGTAPKSARGIIGEAEYSGKYILSTSCHFDMLKKTLDFPF